MTVNHADYTNYRNIESARLEFSPGVNVLFGMNAQGKSNILEGIYYFARGRSFRGAKDRELIRFGADFSRVKINFSRPSLAHGITLESMIAQNGRKRLSRNGAPIRSVSEMLGSFRAVLFCPAHLAMVTGGPAERRAFLDIAVSQLSGAYIDHLSKFRTVLAERNALLRRHAAGLRVTAEEWEVYAGQISQCAAEIASYRRNYCMRLSAAVAAYFEHMTTGSEKPALSYTSHLNPPDYTPTDHKTAAPPEPDERARAWLFERLMSNIERESAAGATLWGPHKDDIKITINGHEARLFASQGQQRSLALAMKLSEGEIAREMTGEYPVFLLDDVFSELDETRRRYLIGELKNRQIIVTSCEPSVISREAQGAADISFMQISGGRVIL